jgi:hypothetical protein
MYLYRIDRLDCDIDHPHTYEEIKVMILGGLLLVARKPASQGCFLIICRMLIILSLRIALLQNWVSLRSKL